MIKKQLQETTTISNALWLYLPPDIQHAVLFFTKTTLIVVTISSCRKFVIFSVIIQLP